MECIKKDIFTIPVSHISTEEKYFKISRNNISEELLKSVSQHGVMDPPCVLSCNACFKALTGFNRLEAARISKLEEVDVYVTEEYDHEIIMSEAVRKSYSGLIGTGGRLRCIIILRERFCIDEDQVIHFAENTLKVPRSIFSSNYASKITELSAHVFDYFDMRDVPFKTVTDFLNLPQNVSKALGDAAYTLGMRLNLFKSAVLMCSDICRVGNGGRLLEVFMSESHSDQDFWDRIFQTRYPEYTAIISRAETLAASVSGKGLSVILPKHLEGDVVKVSLNVRKGDKLEDLIQRLHKVDPIKLEQLTGLL